MNSFDILSFMHFLINYYFYFHYKKSFHLFFLSSILFLFFYYLQIINFILKFFLPLCNLSILFPFDQHFNFLPISSIFQFSLHLIIYVFSTFKELLLLGDQELRLHWSLTWTKQYDPTTISGNLLLF